MSTQTIQSQDIRVADVFQSFYVVPDYQREYVWGTDQVEQLLTDIYMEITGSSADNVPEYFIGSIVVCPGDKGVFDLIDGQQRMTTLFVTLCAIRDRFKSLNSTPPGAIDGQIAATSTDASGNDQFRYRLDLQYEDSGDVLVRLATSGETAAPGGTRSIANILNAYQVALSFMRREFGDDVAKLRGYYGYLTNKVKLIRIQTENVAKALKIFETINDRGVGLDAMDLLKNLLFMKASHEKFEELKRTWKEMQDAIYAMGEKPLRFLRYFIFSRYDVDLLREDEIYTWFSKHETVVNYGAAPVEFAKELLAAAMAYRCFLDGCDQRGKKNRYLTNLQLLGGKAARQHLILLLAGRHLPEALFDQLAKGVEDLFFVYVVTREATRDFEKNFARWSGALRKVRSEDDLGAFLARTFASSKASLAQRFDDAVLHLGVGAVQQYRLRYILAKLTQQIELDAYGETDGTKWLDRYTDSSYEIEHIFPQNPSPEAASEFGAVSDATVAGRLGNLLLVEKSINASLGNRPFSHKRTVYPKSQLLLTRSISERLRVGVNTKIDAAVSGIEPFATWNQASISKRQEMLLQMARAIWCVSPDAGG